MKKFIALGLLFICIFCFNGCIKTNGNSSKVNEANIIYVSEWPKNKFTEAIIVNTRT